MAVDGSITRRIPPAAIDSVSPMSACRNEQNEAAATTIPIDYYSTEGLPAEDRYRAWLMRNWPRERAVYRTEPTEPFNTCWEASQLGEVTFVYTEITGQRWERRKEDIRESDFDPIIINLMIEGLAQGDMNGQAFYEPAGSLHFHDLGLPSLHVSTASKTYAVIIPRAVAHARFGPLSALHGLVVSPPKSDMLFAHAAQVRRALPRLSAALAPALGRVFLDLIEILVGDVAPGETPRTSPEQALLSRAKEEIERRLGAGNITAANLSEVLGVPRARLFAAFAETGGLHAYIVSQRLERARTAIAEVDRGETIGAIAHRLGFSDASHLSRSFRTRFGMTPREYRGLVGAQTARDLAS